MAEQQGGVARDRWLDWLLSGRDAGDQEVRRRSLDHLRPIYERVLDRADLREGQTVLEVGAGEGQLGLLALERVGPTGRLVLTDVSESVITHLQTTLLPRLQDHLSVAVAPVESLAGIPDHSVDLIVVRSVLIYASELAATFNSFARVLTPAGRISAFEPWWAFTRDAAPAGEFFGRDLSEVADDAQAVLDGFAAQSPSTGFAVTPTTLVTAAEAAGFHHVDISIDAQSVPLPAGDDAAVHQAVHGRPNPLAPTTAEVVARMLSGERAARFLTALEAAIRFGGGQQRTASIYLTAER